MPPPAVLPADLAASHALLQTLLHVSLTGVILFRPVYAAGEDSELVDWAYAQLNPAAQRMLGLPAYPTQTFLSLYPHAVATGIFAFYRDTFLSGQPGQYQANYSFDGLDNYFLLSAQRSGELLLVSFSDTSEQPRTAVEEALRQSQAREQAARAEVERQRSELTRVFELAPVAIAVYEGPEHRIELANPISCQLLNRSADELLGKPLFEALPELAGHGFEQVLASVYTTGQPVLVQERAGTHARAGRLDTLYWNLAFVPMRAADGRITGALSVGIEVTEQVLARQRMQTLNQELETRVAERTETALALQADVLAAVQRQVAEREAFYQVFEQTPAAICIQRGPEHRYAYANQAYRDFFPGRLLLGQPVAEALPETVDSGVVALLDRVYQTGEPYEGTELPLLIAQPQGPPRQMYFTFTYQPYREHGAIVGISTFAYNAAEQVLARREREAQQQLVNLVFEQAPLPVFVATGPTFVLEVINAQAARLFHKTREQLLGLPYADAFPEFMQQGFGELLRDVWQSGQARTFTDVPVYFRNRPPQELGYFTFVYQPLLDAQGQVHEIVCVGIEVTDQVRARQQVQDLNEELAAINEELTATNEELYESNTQLTRTNVDLDTFIYAASHDLKAPITNIEGLLLALEHELPAAARTGDVLLMLTLMQDATERFRRTINHLTDLSRLQKEYNSAADVVALAPVVEAVRLDLSPLLAHTQGQLTVTIPEGLTVTFAEKNLRSVVYNLLSNAFKYYHPDREPAVQLRSFLTDQYVVLEVQDNGLGLDLTQGQEQLFAMFQRLHTHVEGTGVGLYMVKRIVENAGGHIEVSSQLGLGSTFQVYFRR
ncbi:PAS domain-containing protein [Hymenobacter sp. GOD-10R]|uniref:PAS domain-containing protein n=1 Tax=Hymenobacter sp. GOD-10R TaxID=3093922 RepID=UPI002D792D9F|nr:PAS domain-containing protein [Hymenobacter sp. GOD-10R]WRQ31811.1 PAS domain-containing protein [Hymenobacter sp. GOD-10R]